MVDGARNLEFMMWSEMLIKYVFDCYDRKK